MKLKRKCQSHVGCQIKRQCKEDSNSQRPRKRPRRSAQHDENVNGFYSLPPEMWVHILSFLDDDEVPWFAHTCRDARFLFYRVRNRLKLSIRGATRSLWRLDFLLGLDLPKNYETIFFYAGETGNIDMAKYLTSLELDHQFIENYLLSATRCGHLHVLQWAHNYIGSWKSAIYSSDWGVKKSFWFTATSYGHLHICEWFMNMGDYCMPRSALKSAIRGGHLNVVEYLINHILKTNDVDSIAPIFPEMLYDGIRKGHYQSVMAVLSKLKLYKNYCYLFESAVIKSNYLPLIKLLVSKDMMYMNNYDIHDAVAGYANFETIRFLETTNYNYCSDIASKAAYYGNFESLKYFVEKKEFGLNGWGLSYAAKHGNIEMLDYILKHLNDLHRLDDNFRRMQYGDRCYITAARAGHVHMLRHLHDVGLLFMPRRRPLNDDAISNAAYNGHFECVEFLIEIGYPRTSDAICLAAYQRHHEILKLLRQHKFPGYRRRFVYDYENPPPRRSQRVQERKESHWNDPDNWK